MIRRIAPAVLVLPWIVACGAGPTPTTNRGTTAHDATSPAAMCLADTLPARPAPQDPAWREPPCGDGGRACAAACERGEPDACLAVAYALERTEPDPSSTRRWYARACRLGSLNGCINWAAGFREEESTDAELACAARVFERTCAGSDTWGCGMWGLALLLGRGVARDPARAGRVLMQACEELGHFSCAVLADALAEEDPETAALLRQRACTTGYPDACD